MLTIIHIHKFSFTYTFIVIELVQNQIIFEKYQKLNITHLKKQGCQLSSNSNCPSTNLHRVGTERQRGGGGRQAKMVIDQCKSPLYWVITTLLIASQATTHYKRVHKNIPPIHLNNNIQLYIQTHTHKKHFSR